jgi:hypothetical protein
LTDEVRDMRLLGGVQARVRVITATLRQHQKREKWKDTNTRASVLGRS